MAVFEKPEHIYVWQLDIQDMASFSVNIRYAPLVIICKPFTSHMFIPQLHIVEIWEVSITNSHMIFQTFIFLLSLQRYEVILIW